MAYFSQKNLGGNGSVKYKQTYEELVQVLAIKKAISQKLAALFTWLF